MLSHAGDALPGQPLKLWKEVIEGDLEDRQLDRRLVHNQDAWGEPQMNHEKSKPYIAWKTGL